MLLELINACGAVDCSPRWSNEAKESWQLHQSGVLGRESSVRRWCLVIFDQRAQPSSAGSNLVMVSSDPVEDIMRSGNNERSDTGSDASLPRAQGIQYITSAVR